MKLEQKRAGYKRSFELKGSALKIIYNDILSSNEWSIAIEDIGHKKEVKFYSRVGINFVGYFFALIALLSTLAIFFDNRSDENIVTLIVGIIFTIALSILCFKIPLDNYLMLKGGIKDIKFFLNHPSRKEVEEFADELIKKSKKIVLEKYSRVDPDIPEEDFFKQINWLLQNNYLTEKQYEEKKSEYKISKIIE